MDFVCPACGGTSCTSTAQGLRQVLDMPVTCDDCGAKVRLTGMRVQLLLFAVLFAVLTAVFFSSALNRLHDIHPLVPHLGVVAVIGIFGALPPLAGKYLMRWKLGDSAAGPDET